MATADRTANAIDREQARTALRRAQIDPLTGAYGRELGLAALESAMDRARRGNGRLVLAAVDVDGLKQINDRHGHAAGDKRLRSVVSSIQSHVRSYDLVVRTGGDEFICSLEDAAPEEADRRFQTIRAAAQRDYPGSSFSVGFAALQADDLLGDLIARADAALYEAKRRRR